MRWPVAVLLGGALGMPAAGCRNCDLVEAELRTRERELRELKEELQKTECFNEALQRELQAVRPNSASKLTPELASQVYTLKEIALGRQTGGYCDDVEHGDNALQVVVEPHDPDGHAIKAPGSLHVEAVQINLQGLKSPLSFWDVPPEGLRRTWQNGLLSSGYHLILPWKVPPSYPRLRVTARLTLADGRVYEADKDVTVRLPPSPKQGPVVLPESPEVPFPIFPAEPLPVPREMPPRTPGDRLAPPREATGPDVAPTTSWRRTFEPVPLWQSVHLLKPAPG